MANGQGGARIGAGDGLFRRGYRLQGFEDRQRDLRLHERPYYRGNGVIQVHAFLSKLMLAKRREIEGNPNGFPLMPRRNKATEGRRRAMFAATPSYTCCSLSPKISHRYARCDFRGPRYFLMARILL